jgi:hypothetical protein
VLFPIFTKSLHFKIYFVTKITKFYVTFTGRLDNSRSSPFFEFGFITFSDEPIAGWFIEGGIEDGFVDFVGHFDFRF